MEVLGAIAMYFIVSFIYKWWKERRDANNKIDITKETVKQENEMENTEQIEKATIVGTRDLFLETLTKIGFPCSSLCGQRNGKAKGTGSIC